VSLSARPTPELEYSLISDSSRCLLPRCHPVRNAAMR